MKSEFLYYKDKEGLIYEGYIAYDETTNEKKPCVLICHAWGGQSKYEREIAEYMVELGYTGFAIDIYGKGIRGDEFQNNEKLIEPFMKDRLLLKERLILAVNAVQTFISVDKEKIAALGFCFGGLCSLDLARISLPEVLGVISFHGLLNSNGLEKNKINTKILILNGYNDPMVSQEDVINISEEFEKSEANWQIHQYSNTYHAFSIPFANLPEKGILYNKISADRAWKSAKDFLNEVFV